MAKTMSFTRDVHIRENIGPQLCVNSWNSDKAEAKNSFVKKHSVSEMVNKLKETLELCKILAENHNVYSRVVMYSAGFHYIGDGDTARCDECGLEVSNWTLEKKPFIVHAERSPNCPFVRSMLSDRKFFAPSVSDYFQMKHESMDYENSAKRQKVEANDEMPQRNTLIEVDMLKETRKRTFSHWPLRTTPSRTQMIEAGFFSCNVGDRVICIYCNLICERWNQYRDDPWETHKKLSHNCSYVKSMLKRVSASSTGSINNTRIPFISPGIDPHQLITFDNTAAHHQNYINIQNRYNSFSTCPKISLQYVYNLARAGFFYAGTNTVVRCFFCDGCLKYSDGSDNPAIDHARRFPRCTYAKYLCGPELYKKIQKEKEYFNEFDVTKLSDYVRARLDLPVVKKLVNQGFPRSLIERCYEKQLQLKREDFDSDYDLLVAGIILQKQIECFKKYNEHIIIPSKAMEIVRKTAQEDPMSSSEFTENTSTEMNSPNSKYKLPSKDLCASCSKEKKSFACIPCGHYCLCVKCIHFLKWCPICGRKNTSFLCIYF